MSHNQELIIASENVLVSLQVLIQNRREAYWKYANGKMNPMELDGLAEKYDNLRTALDKIYENEIMENK